MDFGVINKMVICIYGMNLCCTSYLFIYFHGQHMMQPNWLNVARDWVLSWQYEVLFSTSIIFKISVIDASLQRISLHGHGFMRKGLTALSQKHICMCAGQIGKARLTMIQWMWTPIHLENNVPLKCLSNETREGDDTNSAEHFSLKTFYLI
jgi:hypothetical protein